MSEELKTFLEHFKRNCSVMVVETIEERNYFHWKRLCFESLNSEELGEISKYIIKYFSQIGNYSHILPKVHAYQYLGGMQLCLTIEDREIRKFLM